jgi:maltoporin
LQFRSAVWLLALAGIVAASPLRAQTDPATSSAQTGTSDEAVLPSWESVQSDASQAPPAAEPSTEPSTRREASDAHTPPSAAPPSAPLRTSVQLQEARDEGASRKHDGHFAFGSFGRVHAAGDLRGSTGRSTNIVAFGSRTDISDYAELELRREDKVDELQVTIDATLALFGEFFHFDSNPAENIAVRNLYADVANAFIEGLGFWAGSRMVRGDDIYLLNVWLLDNLNLIGGGARYVSEGLELSLHGGLTRPDNAFYRQTIDVVPSYGVTPQQFDLLDRPRAVIAAKATFFPFGKTERGLKIAGYAEGHRLPSGQRESAEDQVQSLPSDRGFVAGAQVGLWLDKPRGFLNVFGRVATGIAVYDPLSTPMQLGTVAKTEDAREWRFGFAQSMEQGMFGLQLGGYMRGQYNVVDDRFGTSRLLEGSLAARPYLWFGRYAGVTLDASYQALARGTLDDRTGKQIQGGVTKLGVTPFLSPYGRGTYTRPHIHLIYQVSLRDSGARALYAERDPRSRQDTEHYIAVGAEWWFNSTSY